MNIHNGGQPRTSIPRHSFACHDLSASSRRKDAGRWTASPQGDGTLVGYRVCLNTEVLEYRLIADGDGLLCERVLSLSDGSQLVQSLVVADVEAVTSFLDSDIYAGELRADFDRFVDLCASRLASSSPPDSAALTDADEAHALLCGLAESTGVADLLERCRAVVRFAGGEQFLFVLATREAALTNLQFVIGCDPSFVQTYVGRRWHAIDPFAICASRSTQCLYAGALELRSRGQMDLRMAMVEAGFASAMSVPVRLSSSLYAFLIVGNDRPGYAGEDVLRRHRALLRLLALEMFDFLRRQAHDGVTLTEDERRLLLFVDEGIESREVASLLGTTEGMVNKRYSRINAKLRVKSKSAALQAAIDLGLLHPAFSAAA